MNPSTSWLAAALAVIVSPGGWSGALAQEPAEDADALRGPAVPAKPRSLVRHEASGQLIRVERRPEEAALDQLVLDPERREKAREVIAQRGAALRALLVEQIDLVKETTDAIQAGEREKAEELGRELSGASTPSRSAIRWLSRCAPY
jgi:hypothetical protein